MYTLIDSKPFHHMNARVETVRFDDGMPVKRLVSYDSVVCDVSSGGRVFFYPRHDFSVTTRRQVTRFLDEYAPRLNGARWRIGLIRALRKSADEDGYADDCRSGVYFLGHVLGTTYMR
jgi:hypothetical protein